jgi:hypothetical protein
MHRWGVVGPGAVGLAILLAGCAGMAPRIQTGPDAETTPDGLHKVDGVAVGTLFMKPDYVFGSYRGFVLGDTEVTFQKGSRVLEQDELAELVQAFEGVAREAIRGTGRSELAEGAPCVAEVNLALVDLNLAAGTASGVLGAVTLVLEIRDGVTREALLRYGQRRRLSGVGLGAAFKRYADRFQRDFEHSLPARDPAQTVVSCAERAAS